MLNVSQKQKSPKIVYQDEVIQVVNKPAGWVTLDVKTFDGPTLETWVKQNFPDWAESVERAGIAHRLDKDTTGIVIGAKNQTAFQGLKKQFKKRIVNKVYLALVRGNLRGDGTIKVPLGRKKSDRFKYGVRIDGKPAETKFQVLGHYWSGNQIYSLVEAYPKTGRTHQLRVHFHYLGHPIFGDRLYGGTMEKGRPMFLVAKEISFLHPETKKPVRFEIDLPTELKSILENYEKKK